MKSCAFIQFTHRPNTTAVSLDNPVDNRKAHTRAFEVLWLVQSLKDPEEFVGILGIKPGPIVFNVILALCAVASTADFNPGLLPAPCEFDRIGQKVDKDLAH